jgi:polyisoprenoid-binding protein YceI
MTASADTTATTYTIDPTHSRVSFAVRHMMLSKVRGEFGDFKGTIDVGPGGVPTKIDAEITVESIDTKTSDRDTHLKSPDFFNAPEHPTITFQSTDISGSGTNFIVKGNLTLHGVTKPIELKVENEGSTVDPWGKKRVAYTATTRLNRKDFGLTWNQTLETGGVLVGEDVDVTLDIQAVA